MHPYAPPETVLRHLAEQAERDRRNPHVAARTRTAQDGETPKGRRWQRGQK
jgi:hypothetical protein